MRLCCVFVAPSLCLCCAVVMLCLFGCVPRLWYVFDASSLCLVSDDIDDRYVFSVVTLVMVTA